MRASFVLECLVCKPVDNVCDESVNSGFNLDMWPTDEHGIISRSEALDAGVSERQLTDAIRRGELLIVGRGHYSLWITDRSSAEAAEEEYRRRSLVAGRCGPLVLSHESAASLHGLRLLYPDHEHIHMTNGRGDGGYRQSRRIVHPRTLTDNEIVVIDGVLATSLERTVVDVALGARNFAQALTAFDCALARDADVEAIGQLLAERRRGVNLARRAFGFADGRSESPGESWSRAQMIDDGLPVPDLQVEYALRSGRTARCDFGIDDVFVGEFDGLVKYRRNMRRGEEPEDVVIREKIREDELRDLGLVVVRWVWEDLRRGRLMRILRSHYARLGIRV